MHDHPTVDELLVAVHDYLTSEVAATSDRRARFRALIAANVLAIVRRELESADDDAHSEDAGLAVLGYRDGSADERRRALAREIRSGAYDPPVRFDAAFAFAREMVARKLAVSNPRYLKGSA